MTPNPSNSSRPERHDESDGELRIWFGRLAEQHPDEAVVECALGRARRALLQTQDDLSAQRSAARAGGRGLHFWFWRIAMPVMGLLTTAALVVAFLFTSATSQVASAAEILERAAKARAEFDGWYTLEVRHPETGAWHVVQQVNLAEGKWFERDSDDPEQYCKTFHDAAWAYGNEREPILIEYRADTRTATVQGYSSDSYSWSDLPINETQLREWIEAEGMYESLPQVSPEGVLRIDLVKRSGKPDAEGQIDPAYENWPVRIEMTFTQKRGLLSGIAVQQAAGDMMAPWARITYGTPPIERWEDLIDETIEVRDLRPDASTRALIDGIDAVWRDGLGFDTAILVKRTGDPIKGTLNDRGRVTLYAERGDGACAKFE